MPRNPKIDPQPGDVVQVRDNARKVVRRVGYDIYYTKPTAKKPDVEHICWLTTWQTWCVGGRVIQIGEQKVIGSLWTDFKTTSTPEGPGSMPEIVGGV